jgi:valyl-tRNA synthetase
MRASTVNVNNQPDAELMVIRQFVKAVYHQLTLFSLITGEDTGGTWSRLTGTGGVF